MTKILIEIDTDTHRVVPVKPTDEMLCAAMDAEDAKPLSDWGKVVQITYEETYAAMLAAAPQPEPVDADLRRDAELWRAHQKRKQDLIDRGFLKSCLRSEESAMSQGE